MQTFNFPFRGNTITVSIGREPNEIYWEINDNPNYNTRYLFNEMRLWHASKISKMLHDVQTVVNGAVVGVPDSAAVKDTDVNEYDLFFDLEVPAGQTLGLYLAKLAINTMLDDYHNIKCFNPLTGDFYEPVTADVTSTPPTVADGDGTIQIVGVDGLEPFEYKLYDQENDTLINDWSATGLFENLTGSVFTVSCRDQNGIEYHVKDLKLWPSS